MKRAPTTLARVAAALLAAAPILGIAGSAAADGPTVTIGGAARNGGSATVTGVATFSAISAPESVGGENTNWANADVANAAGIDLTDGKIIPLADGTGLRFIWTLTNLPPQIPPEAVRYTWSFKIGTTQYQLQAKRTNIASATTAEDPEGHIMQLASGKEFFQLRGACTDHYPVAQSPVAGCWHLAFLNGAFDIANKTVSIDLPFQTKDAIGRLVAPDFKPGVVLLENQSAGMSIAAAFQAVAGNTSTSDFTNGWTAYYVGPQVALAVGRAGTDPTSEDLTYANATLNADGTFSGTVSGLTTTNNTVYARACNGETCAYASIAP